jgi:hypothetical protein
MGVSYMGLKGYASSFIFVAPILMYLRSMGRVLELGNGPLNLDSLKYRGGV